MSFANAIDQIVTMVESATPTYKPGEFGNRFKHYPDADEDNAGKVHTRGFWWDLLDVSTNSHHTVGSGTRSFASVDVVVSYQDKVNRADILKAMASDYVLIRSVLIQQAQWNQPASQIIALSRGGEEIMLSSIERRDGARLMRFRIPLEFTEAEA